jgi:hypothetical protein
MRELTQLGQKLGKSAKRFSIEDEGCASEARLRRVGGPSRSEAALLDQQDSPSIRLVHTWAWRAGEKRNCEFYRTTERGSDSERVTAPYASRAVLSAYSKAGVCASTRSSLCLRAANTQGLHEASQRLSSTTSTTVLFPLSMGLCISTTFCRQQGRQSTGRINQGAISGDSNAESPSMSSQPYV